MKNVYIVITFLVLASSQGVCGPGGGDSGGGGGGKGKKLLQSIVQAKNIATEKRMATAALLVGTLIEGGGNMGGGRTALPAVYQLLVGNESVD